MGASKKNQNFTTTITICPNPVWWKGFEFGLKEGMERDNYRSFEFFIVGFMSGIVVTALIVMI